MALLIDNAVMSCYNYYEHKDEDPDVGKPHIRICEKLTL